MTAIKDAQKNIARRIQGKPWRMVVVGVSFTGAAFAGWEFGALQAGLPPICSSDGCTTAGAMMAVDKSVVLLLATMFFLSIGAMVLANKKKLQNIFTTLLCGGAAFDGALVGNLLATGTLCTLCLVVAGILLILILAVLVKSPVRGFAAGSAWVAAALAVTLVGVPASSNFQPTRSAALSYGSGTLQYHLYVSLGCSNCAQVMKALSKAEDIPGQWYVHFPSHNLSDNEADIVEYAKGASGQTKKIWQNIIDTISASSTGVQISAASNESKGQSRMLAKLSDGDLQSLGISKIPVLIVTQPGQTLTLVGSGNILKYLGLNFPNKR